MARDPKRSLDRDWHQLVTQLNEAYDAALAATLAAVREHEDVTRLMLVGITWHRGRSVEIAIGGLTDDRPKEAGDAR